jgi:putative membrane protein
VTESALNLKAQVMVLNAVAQAAALLAALIHIAVSPLECFLIDRPAVQRFLRIQAKNISDIRLWAFAIGAHNLVVGLGTILGLVILHTGDEVVGKTLVLAGCVFMFLGGPIMALADMLGFYPRKGDSVIPDIASGLLPLVALVAAAI